MNPQNTQLGGPAVVGVVQAPGVLGFQGGNGTPNAQAIPLAPVTTNPTISVPSKTGSTGGNTNTNTGGNTGGTTGLDGTTLNAPQYIQGIQQEYGATINNAPTAANILTSQEGAAEKQYNDTAGTAIANAQQQNNANQAVLQGQIGTTKQGQTLSLTELASQIRAQHQGLGAQLGSVGAGSSSASLLGDEGLAQEQNTSRANIQQQAGSNISNLETQEAGQTADTGTLVQGYQKTAADQVATVKENYAQLMNQLATSLNQAQGEEKARLAEFGQTLTDAANTSLNNIESQLTNNTGALLTSGAETLNQGSLPAVTQVNPVTAPQVTPFNVGANSGNATAAPAGGSLYTLLQQQSQQPVGTTA